MNIYIVKRWLNGPMIFETGILIVISTDLYPVF